MAERSGNSKLPPRPLLSGGLPGVDETRCLQHPLPDVEQPVLAANATGQRLSAQGSTSSAGTAAPPAPAGAPPPSGRSLMSFTGSFNRSMFGSSMAHLVRDGPEEDSSSPPQPASKKLGWSKIRGVARGVGMLSRMKAARSSEEESGSGAQEDGLAAPLLPRPARGRDLLVSFSEPEPRPESPGREPSPERTTPDRPGESTPMLSPQTSDARGGFSGRDALRSRNASFRTTALSTVESAMPAAMVVMESNYRGVRNRLRALPEDDAGPFKAIVTGTINALVAIPAQTAFATIVFQDALYAPFLGALCKFFFFSSAVHQIVFMFLSTLPYAVGQVQDVGLIFLSSMATSIASVCLSEQLAPEVALGTTLLTFCISTFTVGLLTLLVGKFKLAQLVQYVPLPVVGGYLGYVGYFIVAGGAGLVTGVQLDSVLDWFKIFTPDRLLKLLPMFGTTWVLMRACHFHPAVLPLTLLLIPGLFHLVLLAFGVTLEQCQDADWVMKPMSGMQHFWDLWRFFNMPLDQGFLGAFSNVHWPALTSQLAKIAGLFLVVCFGSGMDVAAIQQDSPSPLNFNQELVTVGASNMVTALLGAGYTGSYIFSQTIFTMKAGIKSRLSSAVIASAELAVFALPFSVVQYVPKFFFGALLLWFGVEIVRDWLFVSYRKLSWYEYVLLWLTFVAIMWLGLELGIAAGIVMVTLVFAYEYAQSTVSSMNPVSVTSGTMYSYSHMALLDLIVPRRVVGISLNGFLFFGNSVSISDRLEVLADEMIAQAEKEASDLPDDNDDHGDQPPARPGDSPAGDGHAASQPSVASAGSSGVEAARLAFARSGGGLAGLSEMSRQRGRRFTSKDMQQMTLSNMIDCPMFMILDFRLVPRLDSTGSKTFSTLVNKLDNKGVQVLVCGLPEDPNSPIRLLLAAHKMKLVAHGGSARAQLMSEYANFAVPDPFSDEKTQGKDEDEEGEPELRPGEVWEFPSLDIAAKYVEDEVLALGAHRGLVDRVGSAVMLEDVLRMHVDSLPHAHVDPVAALLRKYMSTITLARGQVLFKHGDNLDGLYIIESGKLHLYPGAAAGPDSALRPIIEGESEQEHHKDDEQNEQRQHQEHKHDAESAACPSCSVTKRAVEYGPGSLVCPHDFALRRPASATARCFTMTARVMLLPHESFEKLMADAPAALSALQVALTRSLSLDLSSSLGLADRAGSMLSFRGVQGSNANMSRSFR